MCSAMGQQSMVIESIQAGAKDFIVKPFQPDRVARGRPEGARLGHPAPPAPARRRSPAMVTLTPTRHGSPTTPGAGRAPQPARGAAVGAPWRARSPRPPPGARGSCRARRHHRQTDAGDGEGPAKPRKAAADDPESLPIPEGSSGPAEHLRRGAGGTLLRLGLGLGVVVGLIGARLVRHEARPALALPGAGRPQAGRPHRRASPPPRSAPTAPCTWCGWARRSSSSAPPTTPSPPIARIGADDGRGSRASPAPTAAAARRPPRGRPGRGRPRPRADDRRPTRRCVERLRAMTARK